MDEYIFERIKKHYEHLEFLGYNVVGVFAQGSMNYGLFLQDDDYKSDVDTKAIVLPTLDDLIKGTKMTSTKYDFEGEQIDVKDIRVMLDMWRKANPSYLEILFTKYKIINPEFEIYINKILENRDKIVDMNQPLLAKCISGMSREKVAALEHPYPSQLNDIEKFGYCPKQLNHIVRLNKLIQDIYLEGKSFGSALDLSKQKTIKKYLIGIKKGNLPLENARITAKVYDERTREIRNDVVERYENFVFNSKIYDFLKGIIYNMMKNNIVNEIKDRGIE